MDFKDLNELNFLTIKTDFLLDISNKGENIKERLLAFKAMDMTYDEIFRLILKSIESLKGRLVDGIIPKLLLTLNEIFNIENDMINVYIELLNCYVKCDIENYNLEELYNDEFANKACVEFNMLFAPYYLNVLVDRYGELNEISRVNNILKNTIEEFKVKYGR